MRSAYPKKSASDIPAMVDQLWQLGAAGGKCLVSNPLVKKTACANPLLLINRLDGFFLLPRAVFSRPRREKTALGSKKKRRGGLFLFLITERRSLLYLIYK